MAPDWNMDVKTVPCADFEPIVRHLWSLSFNYGYFEAQLTRNEKDARQHHEGRVRAAVDDYNRRFPNGIDHLLEKLS